MNSRKNYQIAASMILTIMISLSADIKLHGQSLGLNNSSPDASSILDLTATDRGFLPPRMTEAQRDAITSPATSLLIYQTDGTTGYYYNSGTPGTPVWTQLITTPTVTEVSATGTINTTSGTDVLATGMSITPGAGDYFVMFSTSVENNTTGTTSFVSIYVNNVQVAHTERRWFTEGSIPNTASPMTTQVYVTSVGAAQAIEARWRVTGGTGSMYQRTLTIIKL